MEKRNIRPTMRVIYDDHPIDLNYQYENDDQNQGEVENAGEGSSRLNNLVLNYNDNTTDHYNQHENENYVQDPDQVQNTEERPSRLFDLNITYNLDNDDDQIMTS